MDFCLTQDVLPGLLAIVGRFFFKSTADTTPVSSILSVYVPFFY